MYCEYCKKLIAKGSKRKVDHQNIAISRAPIWFCSKKCYKRWLEDIQQNKIRTYFIWKVGSVLGHLRFIKKIIQKRGISSIYGSSTKDTHFSTDLEEMI
jgi:hypothetical protein